MSAEEQAPGVGRPLRPDPELIGRFWDAMVAPGDTHEVRIPKTRRGPARLFGTAAGYFTDRTAAVRAVQGITGLDAPAVYVTLNPVERDLRARANNRLVNSIAATTSDDHVTRRRHLLLDFDPARASEISATDAEQQTALQARDAVAAFLADHDWPEPLASTGSGNGGGLIYRLDLPNDAASMALVDGCLGSLAALFDTSTLAVDQSVDNAARITKLIGTVAAKGDDCPELGRVWRLTNGIIRPDAGIVSRDLLEALAALGASVGPSADARAKAGPTFEPASDGRRAWTVAEVLARNGIAWRETRHSYGTAYSLDRCLTSSDHDDGAAIIEMVSGALDYRCHHNSCRGKGWKDVRVALGLPAYQDGGTSTTTGPSRTEASKPAPEPWRPPVPFDAYRVPAFPSRVFPDWLRDFVEAEATATQTPRDLAGLLALAVLATTAARRVVVVARPGWVEPLNLYVLAILPPGTRKSPVFEAATAPVLEYERGLAEMLAPMIGEAQQKQRMAEARLKAAESAAVKAQADEAAFLGSEARDRRLELEQIVIPSPPQLVADDVTAEALTRLLFEQRERAAVFSAEGDLFDIMAGRYSDGSGNFAVYLKGHAGDMLKVNRVGRPPDNVRHPALTLAITAQPAVLEGLIRKEGFRGKGLLARYVYSVPISLVGQRDATAPPVPDVIRECYDEAVHALLRKHDPPDLLEVDPLSVPEPQRLRFDAAAQVRLTDFMTALEPRLGAEGDLAHIADWAGKLAGLAARFAGLLHLAERVRDPEPWRTALDVRTFEDGVALADYALAHALVAFGAMGADPATGAARRLWRWIEKRGEPTVRRADAYQALRGQFPKSADLDAPFALLVEHGYLRLHTEDIDRHAEGRRGPQGRPPSTLYDVNPLALTLGSRNAGNPGKGDSDEPSDDSQHFQDFQQHGTAPGDAGGGRRRVAV